MRHHFLGCAAVLLLTLSSIAKAANIVTEIQEGVGKNDNVKRELERHLLKYLQMSDEELVAAFPLKNADGSAASYTLFAPTNSAFRSLIPQDIGDPYFDPDLRLQVLLRHFVRRRVAVDDLAKLTSLTMASGEVYNVTHAEGTSLLNDANIETEVVIDQPNVLVYVIDRVFVKTEEISAAIERHPSGVSFFGPLPAKPFDELKFPTGGFNRVLVTEEDIVAAAAFAVTEVSKSESVGKVKLVAIKTAESQTFYGDLHKIGLELETAKKDLLNCSVVVFERNWINEKKLVNFHCAPAPSA